MAILNLQERTINAKIVYYGPALGGKTTSLKWVHGVLDPRHEIELVSLNTEQDRTLFFDFLPISLGTIEGFRIKLQAFTVPGQVKYNKTRKYVLTGADAVVFVCDSQRDQLEKNLESLKNLDENLRANGLSPDEIPIIIQYNKRDVEDRRALDELEREMNERGAASFATVAITGEGVFEAFTELAVQTLDTLIGSQLEASVGRALVAALRQRLLTQLGEVHPDIRPARPHRESTRRLVSRPAPFAAARKLVDPEGAEEEDELLRQAVSSNMEVAGLLAEVHEARQELGRKVEELTVLHEAGKDLTSSLDETRVLRTLLEAATSGIGTEHGSLLLPRNDGHGLRSLEVLGFLEDPLAEVMRGRDASDLLPRPWGDPVLLDRESRPDLVGELGRAEAGLREAVLVPIELKGERLATLVVYRVGPKVPSLADRIPFLRAIAAQGAVAIENARLFSRVQDFNRALEATVEERTRDLREALDELRVLDRLKDDFLSSISHELLTPLTSIRSFTEILLDYEGTPPQERQEFLTIIRREAERLTGKLRDVLDLGQIEAGRVKWRPETVEVRPLLNEVFDALKERLLARKVRVAIRKGPNPPRVHADPRWLARVLQHVIQNAVQWSPDGGIIGIDFVENDESLVIEVSDEGPGIPEKDRAKVFDRFKQLGDVTTEKPAGTGVGLPLARAIVGAMGGSIGLESEQGRGTHVRVSLPLAATAPRETMRAEEARRAT